MSVPVSVLIPTKDEEANIGRCLDSVSWADDIYVVDSTSRDRTQEIAREKGAKIVDFKWDGKGPRKKNWALDNLHWANEWVLVVDADECVSPALRDEIAQRISEPEGCAGFVATMRFTFLNRVIRYGAPKRKLILFRHAVTRYERLDVSEVTKFDNEVHEQALVNGKIGRLKGDLLHSHFDSMHRHFERQNIFTDWDALIRTKYRERNRDQEIKPRLFGNHLERRRFLKQVFMQIPGRPLLYFVYSYLLRGGFIDGKPGFIYSALYSLYWFEVSVKMFEYRTREELKETPTDSLGR